MDKTHKTTKVTHKAVKKLTPSELRKIIAGGGCRNLCLNPEDPYCLAYITGTTSP